MTWLDRWWNGLRLTVKEMDRLEAMRTKDAIIDLVPTYRDVTGHAPTATTESLMVGQEQLNKQYQEQRAQASAAFEREVKEGQLRHRFKVFVKEKVRQQRQGTLPTGARFTLGADGSVRSISPDIAKEDHENQSKAGTVCFAQDPEKPYTTSPRDIGWREINLGTKEEIILAAQAAMRNGQREAIYANKDLVTLVLDDRQFTLDLSGLSPPAGDTLAPRATRRGPMSRLGAFRVR